MSVKHFKASCLVAAFAVMVPAALAGPGDSANQQFQRGFYLETHQHNPSEAAAAYQKVVADPQAPESLRQEAKIRRVRCQEDVRTQDMAQLMPANSLAYVEVNKPGQHVAQLAQLLGLLNAPDAAPVQEAHGGLQLPEGLFIPDDLAISPALIEELEKMGGIAAAVTSLDPLGIPTGVVVIHPGSSNLIRGLVETSIQFLPPGEPIDGFRTYRLANDGWLAATHRLFIISRSREEVAATVARLTNPEATSLAHEPGFVRLQDNRKNAVVFAYVAGQSVLDAFQKHARGRESMIARTALDLDHLDNLSASLRTTDSNVELDVRLNLKDGHQNILYGLVRTAPMTRQSLERVPAGSAAVAVLGLNPAASSTAAHGAAAGAISVMDLGRELFGNIVEASIFVLPSQATRGRVAIPEIGVVFAVRDPDKSEALWTQMLALPAMMGAPAVGPPREISIEGQAATEYRFPDAPPIVVAKAGDRTMVAGTSGAVASALSGKSITSDPVFRPLLDTLTSSSSKAVFVHAARVLDVVASVNPRAQRELNQVAPFVGNLSAMLVTEEQPNALIVRAELTGLPDVPKIVRQIAQASGAVARPDRLTATDSDQ